MTDKELKTLKENLWHAADMLRAGAHLAANKYGQPILGLIFLRYADILYKQHKDEIEAEYNKYKGGRREKTKKEISIEKCGFYLPECAYYDEINDAPDDANKATLVKKAMEAIETENAKMEGVLPKEVYGQLVPEEEPELLSKIVRIFKDIPENCTVDIFGEIYEYFLGKFALAEGKDGGTFYTPATVVRYMVEVLNPQPGDKKFLDPACGSGGMFVQAARYMHKGIVGEIVYFLDNILWLLERFPDGKYRDVIGLCKAAKLDGEDGIIDQDYSLNAGRYVGVVIEDDGMTEAEFKETIMGLNAELTALNVEAKKLEDQIAENLKGLFLNEC